MNIKFRLAVMNFLQFAVWGAYLVCMGNFIVPAFGENLGKELLPWFYIIQGIVSIFMPAIIGIVADKFIQPQRMLGLSHLVAGLGMLGCFWVAYSSEVLNPTTFIVLYTLSVAFYMPTIALTNTVAFTVLKKNGYDTVKDFPPIRVLGTVGFIASMWFVNSAYLDNTGFGLTLEANAFKFQNTYMQFFVSGFLSLMLFLYCYTLPQCPLQKKEGKTSISEALGLNAFKLFKRRQMALFFIFSALLGMCLQVTNSYAVPFMSSFKLSPDPLISDSFVSNNPTMLSSISQISEALCILMIPFFLKRFGIKIVMLMSLFAWVFRFGFFGIGNPAMPGAIFFILSCIVYGVAFDFFNVSGGIFVDQECDPNIKASAQGLFMMMTNGIGASVGVFAAGKIVNAFCHTAGDYLVGDWQICWFVFAAFALVVGITFALVFKPEKKPITEIKH